MDIVRLMCPHSQHVFSIHLVDLTDPLVGRPTTLELGPWDKFQTPFFREPNLFAGVGSDGSQE